MILLADSGSSKTDWLVVENNQLVSTIETPGINPFFQQSDEIEKKLKSAFDEETKNTITEIHYYGAGCIKNQTDQVVRLALNATFPNAGVIEVEDDMLGAARALLGKEAGIACILGTGANSCKYDGEKIIDKVPTLGFILGDEGSGAWLGKTFLNNYFKRAIPADLSEKIDIELKLEMPQVLAAVYRGEYPSRYLAGFSRFLNKNIGHTYVQKLIRSGFDAFLSKNIERYDGYHKLPVNFVGSIAFYYAEILKKVADEKGITVANILSKPIDGLLQYHTTKQNPKKETKI